MREKELGIGNQEFGMKIDIIMNILKISDLPPNS